MTYSIQPNIKALIFDFDGTLVDSMPAHFASWKDAFSFYGATFDEKFFYDHAGVSLIGVVQKFNEERGTQLIPEDVVTKKTERHSLYVNQTTLISQVVDVVKKYHQKLPMAIATGNSRNSTMPVIEMMELKHYFDFIIFGDDVKESKPNPECFFKSADALGVAPQYCEVFEDGEPGIVAATAAGMKVTDIRKWL